MLDEIINYVQSLQRQVEVNEKAVWHVNMRNDSVFHLLMDVFFLVQLSAVPVYEVSFGKSQIR